MSHAAVIAILAAGASIGCGDPANVPSPDATVDTATTPDAETLDEREIITTIRCPVARFTIAEGTEVLPETTLHLDATSSYGDQSAVAHYQWTLTDPNGAEAPFSPDVATPTLVIPTAGIHTIALTVTDARGIASCVPFKQQVRIAMADAIRIELSWLNPNDPDTNGPAADLDLHFLHPLAAGSYDGDGDGQPDGWFESPFDCFWSNDNPNWGRLDDTFDNPELIESEGSPGTLSLDLPEAATYRVGVHYWSDHDLGPALTTVRIYYSGDLVFEVQDVALEEHDMWSVTTLTWPPSATPPALTRVCSGTTIACTTDTDCAAPTLCGPRIAPAYSHPNFFSPE